MEYAFLYAKGELPERLFIALSAGSRAGGDRRGRQSAALLVVRQKGGYGGFNDRWGDYRVDDHLNPIARPGGLFEMDWLYFRKTPKARRVKIDRKGGVDLQKIKERP